MKNQRKRYSEETYLKYTICTTLYLLHENIAKKGFILRNKRDAWRWRDLHIWRYFKAYNIDDILEENLLKIHASYIFHRINSLYLASKNS